MRILSGHLTPLERQTTESVNIVEAEKKPKEALNKKTEWGGAKIPGILVTQPKGVAKQQKEITDTEENTDEVIKINIEPQTYSRNRNKRGTKRLKYVGDDTGANEAFLETLEEEESGQQRQEQEPGTTKRSRRTSPAPNKTSKFPKTTSKSPKPL